MSSGKPIKCDPGYSAAQLIPFPFGGRNGEELGAGLVRVDLLHLLQETGEIWLHCRLHGEMLPWRLCQANLVIAWLSQAENHRYAQSSNLDPKNTERRVKMEARSQDLFWTVFATHKNACQVWYASTMIRLEYCWPFWSYLLCHFAFLLVCIGSHPQHQKDRSVYLSVMRIAFYTACMLHMGSPNQGANVNLRWADN